MSQVNGVHAYDKPVENDFKYVYAENGNKGFIKLTKAMMKVLLGVSTKLSELENDKDFIDNTVEDLKNYYLKTETYSKDELDDKLSLIPKFSVKVVYALPTEDISESTIYLVPSNEGDENLYTEYINVNGLWEILGTQKATNISITKDNIIKALGYTPVSKTDYDAYVQNTDDDIEGMRNVLGMTAPQTMMSMKTQDIVSDIAELKEGSTDALLFDDIKAFPFNEFLQMYHVSDKTPTMHNFYNGFEIIINSNAYPTLPYPFGEFSPSDENVTYEEETGAIIFHLPSDVGFNPDENVFAVIPTDFEYNNDGVQIIIKKGLYLAEKIMNADTKGINIYNFSFGEYQLKGGSASGGATAEQLAQIEQNKKDIGELSDTVNDLLDNGTGTTNAVQCVEQKLTEEQQMQARKNLGLYYDKEDFMSLSEVMEVWASSETLLTIDNLSGEIRVRLKQEDIVLDYVLEHEEHYDYGSDVTTNWYGNYSLIDSSFYDSGEGIAIYEKSGNWYVWIDYRKIENTIPHIPFYVEILDAYNTETVCITIPEEYIPDTIARKEDIPTVEDILNELPTWTGGSY